MSFSKQIVSERASSHKNSSNSSKSSCDAESDIDKHFESIDKRESPEESIKEMRQILLRDLRPRESVASVLKRHNTWGLNAERSSLFNNSEVSDSDNSGDED